MARLSGDVADGVVQEWERLRRDPRLFERRSPLEWTIKPPEGIRPPVRDLLELRTPGHRAFDALLAEANRIELGEHDAAGALGALLDIDAGASPQVFEEESLSDSLADQRGEGNNVYRELWNAHRWRVAAIKLAFVVPLFLLSSWLVKRRGQTLYRPVLLALLVSSFGWVGVVMHQHFPAEFFKYVGIFAAILIVVGFLTHALRTAAKPREDVLLRRRREAYHSSRCPECAYPIPEEKGGSMSCASCGATLYSTCSECEKTRHELLPHCRHCGAETGRWSKLGARDPTT